MDIGYVSDLNRMVEDGSYRDVILISEALHEKKIAEIADLITRKKKHIIFIAGPSSSGKTTFARRLCVMPPAAQEYVVVHEFCHFAHPDHSPAFWAAVAQVLPDYKQRQRLLKTG